MTKPIYGTAFWDSNSLSFVLDDFGKNEKGERIIVAFDDLNKAYKWGNYIVNMSSLPKECEVRELHPLTIHRIHRI
jgi:hypothetical protein